MRNTDRPGGPPPIPNVPTNESFDSETEQCILDEIIEVFHDRERAVSLAISAGFPKSRIPNFRTSLEFWSTVIGEARNGAVNGGIQPFVDSAADLYPGNEILVSKRTKHSAERRENAQQITPRRVFISHTKEDERRTRGLAHLLRALGHDVFVAFDSIPLGSDRNDVSKRALEHCDVVMVLWTKSATTSEPLRDEYRQALSQNLTRPIIPVILDASIPLPKELCHRQEIIFPAIQELLEEKALLEFGGRPPADLAVIVDGVLDRHQLVLSRRQRRDVLIFVGGSATTLGLMALVSVIRRGLTPIAPHLKQVLAVAVFAVGVEASIDSTRLREMKRHAIIDDYDREMPESLLEYIRISSSSSNEISAVPGNKHVHESKPPTSDVTLPAEPLPVCRGARRAIGDLEKTLQNSRDPSIPDTGISAAQKYVPEVYKDCSVTSQSFDPRIRIEVACESALGSPIEALLHASRVALDLDECTSAAAASWSRGSTKLPPLRGRTPSERLATHRRYWSEECDTHIDVYAGECTLSDDDYCSGAKAILNGQFWECLEL